MPLKDTRMARKLLIVPNLAVLKIPIGQLQSWFLLCHLLILIAPKREIPFGPASGPFLIKYPNQLIGAPRSMAKTHRFAE